MSTQELLEELMGCEHMGDVTRVVRRLAESVGVSLKGGHGEWEGSDWDAVYSLPKETP